MTRAKRLYGGDTVRTSDGERIVLVATANGIVIAGSRVGDALTYDLRECERVSDKHLHDADHVPDVLCAGCVSELHERARTCPRCTAEIAVLIAPERAEDALGIEHTRGCRAVSG